MRNIISIIIAVLYCFIISNSNASVHKVIMTLNINDSAFTLGSQDSLICYPGDMSDVTYWEWSDPENNKFENNDSLIITKNNVAGTWGFTKNSLNPDNNFDIQFSILFATFNPPQNLDVIHEYTFMVNHFTSFWEPPEPVSGEDILGYNIWVNSKFCFFTSDTSYYTTDSVIAEILGGMPDDYKFTFYVTAVYKNPEGESAPSNKVTKENAISGIKNGNFNSKKVSLFINYPDGRLVLYSDVAVRKLKIFNSFGQLVDVKESEESRSVSLKNYTNGIYNLQFFTDKGVINRKIAVIH